MVSYTMSLFVIYYVVVVTISNWTVISSVGQIINYTVGINRRCVIHVPRTINIIRIVNVYNTSGV
jgi:hypothetical protein|tara:strand:- start:47 stop:241 length:195 start_codon:yes stop_codon:yes gene_type:complete